MLAVSAHHGGICTTYLVDKEQEIRQEWKKKMIHEGLDFNNAVAQTVTMDIWPTEKSIQYEAERIQTGTKTALPSAIPEPKPSGEFSSGGPAPPKSRPSVPIALPGQFHYHGRPSYKSDDGRAYRWADKRHEICLNWQNGRCKYPDQDCNRAHGPMYLSQKAPSPSPQNKGKKGIGKNAKK